MAYRGTYCDLTTAKAALSVTGTADDAALLFRLEVASRWIDNHCGRHFYAASEVRHFTALKDGGVDVDDLLSVTTLKTDEDGDRTYEVTWAVTDYDLLPFNKYPKHRVEVTPDGSYVFPTIAKGVQLTGLWGYGDGDSATPYGDSGAATNEELDSSETGVTVSSGPAFAVGQTILVESEQMYITGIATNDLTVVRGVNGTTAAAHATAKPVFIWRYPDPIKQACLLETARLWARKDAPFGISGAPEFGETAIVARMDPSVLFLLAPYRLLGVPG